MCKKLLTVFEFKSETSIHILQQQFHELKINDGETIEEFISRVEENAERLKDLQEPASNKIMGN